MQIKKLASRIHLANIRDGLWGSWETGEGRRLFLVITELVGCFEAQSRGSFVSLKTFEEEIKRISNSRYSDREKAEIKMKLFKKNLNDSVGNRMAGAFMGMLDYCEGFRVEIDEKGIAKEVSNTKRKFGSLGAELLDLCGMIKFLHKGIIKRETAKQILARLIWLSGQLDVPLMKNVKYKMQYNNRPNGLNVKY